MSRFMSKDLMVSVLPSDSAGPECPQPSHCEGTSNDCTPSPLFERASAADLAVLKADLKTVLGL